MAHIYQANKAAFASNDYWFFSWWLTRLMLKAGWLHMASSSSSALWDTNGTPANRIPTADPTTNKWYAPTAIGGQTGAVASIGAAFGKDYLLTGLTGLVAPTRANRGGSEGNILTITGAASGANNCRWQITKVVSATSCYARPLGAGGTVRGFGYVAGVANDANNGAISWTESTFLDNTPYAALGSGAWILLQGPTMLKIPFTAAPTGVFLRGENVVQATTGAEGEVLGVTYEPSTGAGYMVISPRHMGSDASGAEGWSNSNAIVGDKSAASVTPSAYPTRYVQQIVFFKGTTAQGTVYNQCIDPVGESARDLKSLTLTAGCTATVAPGAGGTGNGFPTICIATCGTGGSVAHHAQCWSQSYTGTLTNCQYFVGNVIARQGQSQDGTLLNAQGHSSNGIGSMGWCAPQFLRCDNGDEGDVDPFVIGSLSQSTVWTYSGTIKPRTGQTNGSTGGDLWTGVYYLNNDFGGWQGWRNRGLASGDAYRTYWSALPYILAFGGVVLTNASNVTDPERVSATAQTTAPLVLQPIEVVCALSTVKQRKGTFRWLFVGNGFSNLDTLSNKEWLQLQNMTVNLNNGLPAFIPYDGSSTPVQ